MSSAASGFSRSLPLLAALALGAAAAVAKLPGASAAAVQSAPTRLAFEPCRLEHPSRMRAFAAECATLSVPENHARPLGRRLSLSIARIPAVSRRKQPDPLLLIAGGPGAGTIEMYTGVAPAFARVNRDRDIILVDQRGTGRSAPLGCEMPDDALLEAQQAAVVALTRRCLETLQREHDVRQFTTSVAVRDLELVREALGVARLNLYGVSYGTRVAQHYLRRHPRAVRSMILDGVAPPELALGPGIAADAEAALARIFERCRREAACRLAFGDPAEDYRAVRSTLSRAPVEVSLPDPRTGEPRSVSFGPRHLAAVLRLQSYSEVSAALLPHALAAARRERNFLPLAGQFLMLEEIGADLLAYGMHNSVVCTEDLPFVDDAQVDRASLASTYLGVAALDGLRWICSVWPSGVIDADLRTRLLSDAPVLLLSGEDDPVTPPANAQLAMRALPRSRHVVVPGAGHGQVGQTCIDRVFADFLRVPEPARLDVSCLERSRPPPFFLSAAGPAP